MNAEPGEAQAVNDSAAAALTLGVGVTTVLSGARIRRMNFSMEYRAQTCHGEDIPTCRPNCMDETCRRRSVTVPGGTRGRRCRVRTWTWEWARWERQRSCECRRCHADRPPSRWPGTRKSRPERSSACSSSRTIRRSRAPSGAPSRSTSDAPTSSPRGRTSALHRSGAGPACPSSRR